MTFVAFGFYTLQKTSSMFMGVLNTDASDEQNMSI
jgi:hypothetical protein